MVKNWENYLEEIFLLIFKCVTCLLKLVWLVCKKYQSRQTPRLNNFFAIILDIGFFNVIEIFTQPREAHLTVKAGGEDCCATMGEIPKSSSPVEGRSFWQVPDK